MIRTPEEVSYVAVFGCQSIGRDAGRIAAFAVQTPATVDLKIGFV